MSTKSKVNDFLTETKSLYFTNLNQLQIWFESSDQLPLHDKLRVSRESLESYRRSDQVESGKGKKGLKLQIIHDYKNGYQDEEDANPVGYFPSSSADYYYLQFPRLCDEFVYFSHHRISIPPISWVSQCHKSGILCLGTIIFEGDSGKDFNELDKLLDKDNDGVHFKYVKMLCKLCQHYNFDGFLINVETHFSQRKLALQMSKFVASLQLELKLINRFSRLVWYDSFVSDLNKINYGNGITEENYEFLKASDSMLTNYWWTEDHLRKNIELCGSKLDLFVGVDVWGRGMKYGNGGFETSVAVLKLAKYHQNCGIFAPAWTYEYFKPEDFDQNDTRFWLSPEPNSISQLVKTHNSTMYVPSRDEFIFYTNFSQGKGFKFFEKGELLMNDTWINGSLTFEIPQIYFTQKITPLAEDDLKFELYYKDAYQLGTSLKISKVVENEDELSTSGYWIKRQQNKKILCTLFKFDQEFVNDLHLKMSYKYISSTTTHFQIVINYYVVRAVKAIHRVRDGQFKIPMYNNGNKWVQLDETFKIPQHSRVEKLVLESILVEFVEMPDEDSLVLDDDIIVEDWVIIGQKNKHATPSLKTLSLLIGDLSIASLKEAQHPLKLQKVSDLQVQKLERDNKVAISWADGKSINDPLYWNVILDDNFEGTSVVPYFIPDHPVSKVRVDIVTRDGELIVGDNIAVY